MKESGNRMAMVYAENEAGEVSREIFTNQYRAEMAMYGMALYDLCKHLDVGSNEGEERECILSILDEMKDKIANSNLYPHDSLLDIFMDVVNEHTGIEYWIE